MKAKLALALQISPIDEELGLRLAKLLASIETTRRQDVEFVLSARRGTTADIIDEIMRAIRIPFPRNMMIQGMRFGTGWPAGCNDLWAETMTRCGSFQKTGQLTSDAVFTFEPDCLPLRPDWIDLLVKEWEDRWPGMMARGHTQDKPEPHMNGNAIFDGTIMRKHPELIGSDSRIGWDMYHGKLLTKIGQDTSYIFQEYKQPDTTKEKLLAIRKNNIIPAIYHGVKGDTGLAAIESMIADKSFFEHRIA